MEALMSGVVLCKVANLVKPGVIASKKIKVPSAAAGGGGGGSSMSSNAFGAMDNVAEFRNACKSLGSRSRSVPIFVLLLLFFFFSLLFSSLSFLFSLRSRWGVSVMHVCALVLFLVLFFVFRCVCCGVGHLLGE